MKRNKLSKSLPDRSRIALSREEMREFGYRVVDLLAEHFADVREERVGSKADPAKLIPLFADDPPELGRDPNELLAQLERDVLPNNLHVDHPRFFAFVPGPNNFVSTMADAIAAGFNIFNGTWFGGSAAADPPNHVPLKILKPAASASAIVLTKLFGPGTNAKKRG